jgi:hypothetical protein
MSRVRSEGVMKSIPQKDRPSPGRVLNIVLIQPATYRWNDDKGASI